MKKLFVLCFSMLVIFSCEKENPALTESSIDYLPLQVDNYWNFEMAGKYLVKTTHPLNGKEYVEIINNNTSSYYRKEGNKVYVREFTLDNTEEMKFDLGAKTNDTWRYGPGQVTLLKRNAIVTIGEMQVDSCLEFLFHNDQLMDYNHTIWLAPRIGFIQKNCQECYGAGFNTLRLLDANIDQKLIDLK